MQRTIGVYGSEGDGPTFICVGSMHGNEPAGVFALENALAKLRARNPHMAGRFIALIGNVQGLSQKKRYLEKDLNRIWTPGRLARLARDAELPGRQAEELEQQELFTTVNKFIAESRGDVFVLDLHTTSASSKPFAIFGDTLRNRRFAAKLHAPLILGIEEAISGTLIEYLTNLGHIAIAFEAGQHDDPKSVDLHEAAIWLALEASGNLHREDIPDFEMHRTRMQQESQGIPPVLEVCHRHEIHEQDGFKMEPGFENFQQVRAGQRLARDRRGDILAPKDFHVFMPLYQGLGDDGFFLARRVWPFWLRVSEVLRILKFEKLLKFLPGVRKHPRWENAYIVNKNIARFFVIELFHLLGFRKENIINGALIVSKRRFRLHALAGRIHRLALAA